MNKTFNKECLVAKAGVDTVEKRPTQSSVEASKGLVHRIGLELCKRWPETVEAEGFPGLGHGDTLRDKNVMERWVKVLEKVNGDGEASAGRTSKASSNKTRLSKQNKIEQAKEN